MTTADGRALLQVGMRDGTRVMRSGSRGCGREDTLRADVAAQEDHAAGRAGTAAVDSRVAELIVELASAGLVSVDVGDDGDTSYALTPQGQSAARLMAMSGDAHALVLLGALVASSGGPN